MKHIDCPIKLTAQTMGMFNKPTRTQTQTKQIWSRMYGHLLFGLTQQNPIDYYTQYGVQIEQKLLRRITDWSIQQNNSTAPRVILNKPDITENTIITYFFPEDKNVDWTYSEENLHIAVQSTKQYQGVYINRAKNHELAHYARFEKGNTVKYQLSAKHLIEDDKPGPIKVHQVQFTSNRFLQLEGQPVDGYQEHTLQIEELSFIRLFERQQYYWITDIDSCLNGNPHCI